LGYVVVEGRFDDEGYSGSTLDRPALQRLLNVIRSGGIERLVIHRLDRLSRNLRHFTTLFEELREENVALDVVAAPGLGAAALDNLMLSIFASSPSSSAISAPPESRTLVPISKRTAGGSLVRSHSDTQMIRTRSSWSSVRKKPARWCGCSHGPQPG